MPRYFSRMTTLVKVFRMDLRREGVEDINHGVEGNEEGHADRTSWLTENT